MTKLRAAFFFGSGISYRSGAPNVDQITDSALNDEWEFVGGRFAPARPKSTLFLRDDTADKAQKFLHLLRRKITRHLQIRERRKPHYEDFYYAAMQIWQDAMAEYTNPMIGGTTASLKRASRRIYLKRGIGTRIRTFADLAKCSAELIQWAAYEKLCHARRPVEMEAISEVARTVNELDIFSLNHDLLIEAELTRNKIRFADGFVFGNAPLRKFDAAWDKTGKRVRLFKLHGSINWFEFTFPKKGNIPRHRQFAMVNADATHVKKPKGGYFDLIQPEPMFLTGTTIKEQAYGVGLTGELFARFRHRSSQHRTLICCGYGWRDKGINMRLDQWLRDQPENRIVLLHGGSLKNVRHTNFWTHRWTRYRRKKKLVVVPHFLSTCGLRELRRFFGKY